MGVFVLEYFIVSKVLIPNPVLVQRSQLSANCPCAMHCFDG
jgi:hypothetical protein